MHATIECSQSITRVLQYHEHKVRIGTGECIGAGNFIKDKDHLTLDERVYHFERLSSRNERIWKNVFHVYLRFHREDQVDNETMASVAQEYLEGMKFGEQPWLVYRHYDSLIPHAHLVSSNVQEDGKKLKLYLGDLIHSRELTHQLEGKYSLHLANTASETENSLDFLQVVRYGEQPLYPAMSKVLETVIPQYSYTTLDELNAVLGLYAMRASRGKEGSDSYRHGGLLYFPLKADGRDGAICIKASDFGSRPTLRHLEERFAANQSLREAGRQRLETAIDWSLAGSPLSFEAFKEVMQYEGITVVCRQAGDGALRNVWFVDHNTRTVFEGGSLGENYSAEALSRRCIPEEQYRQQQEQREKKVESHRLHL